VLRAFLFFDGKNKATNEESDNINPALPPSYIYILKMTGLSFFKEQVPIKYLFSVSNCPTDVI
jgi:hypothetical protein